MARPPVDVVIPFRGETRALEELRSRLGRLVLDPQDTLVVLDNTPRREPLQVREGGPVRVLSASERLTPGYARNRGAALGRREWIVFIDADTEPAADLLDRYFDPGPSPATVLLAGGVRDEPVARSAPGPARYAYLRRTLSQDRTLGLERWGFVQSVNLAVRRHAFEAVGGFREEIRAAEDADLTYRLQAVGGQIERRETAVVVHRNRDTLRGFVRQAAIHGAGAAWLSRRYDGALPARNRPGLLWWGLRWAVRGCVRAARQRERDRLLVALYEPLWELTFEFGRSLPNERRVRRAGRSSPPAGEGHGRA